MAAPNSNDNGVRTSSSSETRLHHDTNGTNQPAINGTGQHHPGQQQQQPLSQGQQQQPHTTSDPEKGGYSHGDKLDDTISHDEKVDDRHLADDGKGMKAGPGAGGVGAGLQADKEVGVAQMVEMSARLENPLAGLSEAELLKEAERFCRESDLMDFLPEFRKGALLAADPAAIDRVPDLTEEERTRLSEETTHRWRHPWTMYYVAFNASMAAVVQGMDEAVVNGAQIFYYPRFGLTGKDDHTAIIQGLLNSAPYLCCAGFACWLTDPMNRYLGRRGTIWVSCFIAGVASIWEAFTYSTWQLFAARLLLGVGIGPKSATAPVFTAECAPAKIRGALVMQWQVWTAFGIALGDIISVIFVDLPPNVGWRIMLGSTVIAPIIVCSTIYIAPESPRWYMGKGRPAKAFQAMSRLRFTKTQAARDLFYMSALLQAEREAQAGRSLLRDFFTVPRVRRAAWCAGFVMFMQQLCGVNVIAYYSSQVFVSAGFSQKNALLATMGTGLLNWIFALPAFFTIDTFGRRNLLLVTLPCLCVCLLITGFGFFIPQTTSADGKVSSGRIAMVATGLYLFECFYSPGMGPVPFSYSAEAFPLYIRDLGMSFATAVTWLFNFVLAITFPLLLNSFKPQGAFGWYAAWNLIGWVVVFFTMRETKALSLEELDMVFSVPTSKHASYQVRNLKYSINKHILRKKNLEPLPPLYQLDRIMGL